MFRLITGVLATLMISACALLPDGNGLGIDVVQDSDYCGTPTPAAGLHYFNSPEAFGNWITARQIRDLRPAAASLTGVLVVELGQRPSDGYALDVIDSASHIEGQTLVLAMRWSAPGLNAKVDDVLISPCVVIPRPKGEYDKVVLVDQRGEHRAEVTLP